MAFGTVAFVVLFLYHMAGFVGGKMTYYQYSALGVLFCNYQFAVADNWPIGAVARFDLLSFVIFVAIHNGSAIMKAIKG